MSLDIVQLGAQGIKLVVNVKQPDGTARDLTGAGQLKIKIKAVIGAVGKSFAAAFDGSPTNGALTYTLASGDLDALGIWQAQAYYELGAWKGHTEAVDLFEVKGNLA
jgi:hypothetical protein